MKIKNYMEDLVIERINSLLEEHDYCKCFHCFNDMLAIALNALPPRYFSTDKGELYTKVATSRSESQISLTTAVTNAAKKVKENPRHDEN